MSPSTSISPTPGSSSAASRLVLYALSRAAGRIDDYIPHALAALREHAQRIVVIAPAGVSQEELDRLALDADAIEVSSRTEFSPEVYREAIAGASDLSRFDEVLLTGDSWFGPLHDLGAVMLRMAADPAPVWAMVENSQGFSEAFPAAGFPNRQAPWLWTMVRRQMLSSSTWQRFWSALPSAGSEDAEVAFLAHVASMGGGVSYAFPAGSYLTPDPALYAATRLVDDGCPILSRKLFTKYPPFLDRFAVIGREVLRHIGASGFPMALVLQNLARTVPPKSLYAIGGMLEVLPDVDIGYDAARPPRIAAIVHVGDMEPVESLLGRLAYLPVRYDLYITTTDGKRAAALQSLVEERDDPHLGALDVRVTPASRGHDMSDFFVGCRDVLLSDRYDLVVKLHARRMRRKTVNVRRYFRRYQYENLLNTPGYVANVLALFQREPGLGFVFPPMMHIGYSTMGRGWAGLKDRAAALSERLGIHVPLDSVSPLAPYGGMFFCRPEALRLLSSERWRFGDYGKRGASKYQHLAHLQERMIPAAGAELGYHSRTVLTREHAAISHTALESKVDYLFSTTRGWPVEQIQLLQRAGFTGHGGVVALSRMYVRLNHPRAAVVLVPLYDVALRAFVALKMARNNAKAMTAALLGRPWEAS